MYIMPSGLRPFATTEHQKTLGMDFSNQSQLPRLYFYIFIIMTCIGDRALDKKKRVTVNVLFFEFVGWGYNCRDSDRLKYE